MDEIALHIDFLLHTHDCIIVPGLGGFVVNMTEVERSGLWGLNAPTCELIFNSKLTYNDGLLAESLMKTNNESYEVAIKRIESASQELRSRLMKEEQIVWNNLGTFKINKENNLIFLPNKSYIRPQFYGLSNANIKPAALVLSTTRENENALPVKFIVRLVSTAVAVALLFFFVTVSYNNSNPKSQQAEIVSKPLIFNKGQYRAVTPKKSSSASAVTKNNLVATKTEKSIHSTSLPATADSNKAHSMQSLSASYYIVVGVYEVREVADKTLDTLIKQGFNAASMIERPRRLDVYAASFSDRKEAQTFLQKFQTENSRYRDAWILKR